ncbi:MAG: hypothetical protein E6G34_00005, partial [Actinobacteria bacterium]
MDVRGAGRAGSERRAITGIVVAALAGAVMVIAAPAQAAPNTAKAWGLNESGQLGDGTAEGPEKCEGTSACSTTPVAVSSLKEVASVSAGGK